MADTKIIIGLGNPGREYEKTRHNIGFMAVEALARDAGGEFKKCRHARARVAEVRGESGRVIFALPQTYMNHSGDAVRELVGFEKMPLGNMIIVCDDIRLLFGEMRLRSEGSDGGHNGLRSVAEQLGTEQFMRLRLGVGDSPSPELQADYVLSEFRKEEKARLGEFVEAAADCLKLWLCGEAAKAMTQYNKRKRKVNG